MFQALLLRAGSSAGTVISRRAVSSGAKRVLKNRIKGFAGKVGGKGLKGKLAKALKYGSLSTIVAPLLVQSEFQAMLEYQNDDRVYNGVFIGEEEYIAFSVSHQASVAAAEFITQAAEKKAGGDQKAWEKWLADSAKETWAGWIKDNFQDAIGWVADFIDMDSDFSQLFGVSNDGILPGYWTDNDKYTAIIDLTDLFVNPISQELFEGV